MKRTMLVFIIVTLLFYCASEACFAISADSSCVVEVEGGRILHENNAHERRGMASTTKIMTALIAIESEKLDEIAVVSNNAARTEGSSLYLKAGEKVSVCDLVFGLMLNSGNDAAVVIAEHIGGSVEGFVNLMNRRAKELNLQNTNFSNPNGLSDDMHYTTAYELAIIAAHALKNKTFRDIVQTTNKVIETKDTKRKIYLSNHNKLLWKLDGCDGVKTGFTKATGRCLVSSVTRAGFQTVCVTLNAADDWNDHEVLHNHTFAKYKKITLLESGTNIGKVSVLHGQIKSISGIADKNIEGVFEKNSNIKPDVQYSINPDLSAPIAKGDVIGSVRVVVNGACVGVSDVLSDRDVPLAKHVKYIRGFFALFRNVYQF